MQQAKPFNRLLNLVDDSIFARLTRTATLVDLVKNIDLATAGDAIRHCWFPVAGLVSIIAADEQGNEAEVGVIGCDGVVNGSVLLGARTSEMRLLVQIRGAAVRIDSDVVMSEAGNSPVLTRLLLAYERALSVQQAYSALAYARYAVERRLARWILMCGDRVGDHRVDLTHEALAIMLGIRRSGVTVALGALEAKGVITTQRGRISVIDRTALIGLAGTSYGVPEAHSDRLISAVLGNDQG